MVKNYRILTIKNYRILMCYIIISIIIEHFIYLLI